MNHPTPAIVTEAAVRRLPRWALLLLCVAYVVPGLIGREAWKVAEMAAFGVMAEIHAGQTGWWLPQLAGIPLQEPASLPYWLGAWAMQLAPSWMPPDFAVRIPFAFCTALTLTATWYGTYYLARSPLAQPVPFAFGGEAPPTDYARAMADGGLLALLACLGLAQLSHETTPALVQLAFSALLFFAMAAMPYHRVLSLISATIALGALALSGAGSLAMLWGIGGGFLLGAASSGQGNTAGPKARRKDAAILVLLSLMAGLLAYATGLWRWKLEMPAVTWQFWSGYSQLLVWFTWPAWPLALWALWRWRRQWTRTVAGVHVWLPLWFMGVGITATLLMGSADRTLLLALPAMAMLAAFALPTLKRPVTALIDWFTLLFFSGCGLVIWVVWLAMQTGVPPQPAANVARLAPGFTPSFSWVAFALAVLATVAWAWLVHWRVGRHRAAIWKSLVLPATGATLCWSLLMTLWMPLLNYTQSYSALVQPAMARMQHPACAHAIQLDPGTLAAFKIYGKLDVTPTNAARQCAWLITDEMEPSLQAKILSAESSFHGDWELAETLRHPGDRRLAVSIYRRR